jgi:hypothetical protein
LWVFLGNAPNMILFQAYPMYPFHVALFLCLQRFCQCRYFQNSKALITFSQSSQKTQTPPL